MSPAAVLTDTSLMPPFPISLRSDLLRDDLRRLLPRLTERICTEGHEGHEEITLDGLSFSHLRVTEV
jgi:hypothetical protein